MKNTYRITIIDYDKAEKLPLSRQVEATYSFYKNGFDEVVKYLGGRPFRQRVGWTAMIGNKEFIITKAN